MRCLSCWDDIPGRTAVYTKSCNHVFCTPCSDRAFAKELACPLCDTVLPKDGVGTLTLAPDEAHLSAAAAATYGFTPQAMCQVLQLGLQFWSGQKHNETLKHANDMKALKARLDDTAAHNTNLLRALEEERLKKKSLQNDKESLKAHVSELESRYADKSRTLRKVSELYNDLRQVHRRLEHDLRGVHDKSGYGHDATIAGVAAAADAIPKSAVEVKTVERSTNRNRDLAGEWDPPNDPPPTEGHAGARTGVHTPRDNDGEYGQRPTRVDSYAAEPVEAAGSDHPHHRHHHQHDARQTARHDADPRAHDAHAAADPHAAGRQRRHTEASGDTSDRRGSDARREPLFCMTPQHPQDHAHGRDAVATAARPGPPEGGRRQRARSGRRRERRRSGEFENVDYRDTDDRLTRPPQERR